MIYIYIYIYTCTYVYTCVYIYICTHMLHRCGVCTHTYIHTRMHAYMHACIHTYTDKPLQPAPQLSFLPSFFSARIRGHLQMLLDPWEYFHWQSDGVPSTGPLSPQVLVLRFPVKKNRNPNCLVSLALELCLVGQFGSADRLRAVFPLTLRKRVLASSPLLSNPDCPTRDQGRVGGTKYSRGDEWGQGSIPEPYAATVIELTYCTVACMW